MFDAEETTGRFASLHRIGGNLALDFANTDFIARGRTRLEPPV